MAWHLDATRGTPEGSIGNVNQTKAFKRGPNFMRTEGLSENAIPRHKDYVNFYSSTPFGHQNKLNLNQVEPTLLPGPAKKECQQAIRHAYAQ